MGFESTFTTPKQYICVNNIKDSEDVIPFYSLVDGLKEYNITKAFELYSQGKISLWKAAKMAGLTYRGALDELKKRNIPFGYEKDDLAADIKWAMPSINLAE